MIYVYAQRLEVDWLIEPPCAVTPCGSMEIATGSPVTALQLLACSLFTDPFIYTRAMKRPWSMTVCEALELLGRFWGNGWRSSFLSRHSTVSDCRS